MRGGSDTIDVLLPPPPMLGPSAPLRGGLSFALEGETMGTRWCLRAVAPVGFEPTRAGNALEHVFASVIEQMSQWNPHSQLSRYNAAPAGSRHEIGAQFRQVLACAITIADASGGAFDPALGRAAQAWGFGAEPFSGAIHDGKIERTAPGDAFVKLDAGTIIQPGGLSLDLSGIAKGYAVDCGIEALQREGIEHALLEIGGELKAIGLREDGCPWWVDLERSPDLGNQVVRIGLSDWAVATSGHWHRRRTAEGRSWSHTLDPRNGRPVDDRIAAVNVLHPGCMQADALATAIIVLGETEGIAFADRHRLPARITTGTKVIESAAWTEWRG